MEIPKAFSGKLNTDDVIEAIPDGDYSYLLNGVIGTSYDGKRGSLENMVGASIVYNYGSDYKCIGGCRDTANSRHFLFLCDTNTNNLLHKIVEVKQQNNGATSYRDLYSNPSDGLSFSTSYPIQATYVNKYIYFTDNNSQVKVAKVWETGQTKELSTLIRRGGLYAPTCLRNQNSSVSTNLIKDKYFQFAYQYIYNNNEVSVLSPYSTLSGPNVSHPEYNRIVVSIPAAESIPSIVKTIRFAVRIGNSTSFQYIGSIDRTQSAATSIDFYNSVYGGVVETDYELNSHEIPLKARSIEFIKNRLWLGNLVEGYDVPSAPNMSIAVTSTQYANVGDPILTPNVTFTYIDQYNYSVQDLGGGQIRISHTGTVTGVAILYQAQQGTDLKSVSGKQVSLVTGAYEITNSSYSQTGTIPYQAIGLGITPFGANSNVQFSYSPTPTTYVVYRLGSTFTGTLRTFYVAGDEIANNGEKTLPNNSTYKVGLIYKDSDGRASSVALANNEILTATDLYSNRITAQWTLPSGPQINIIPSWATSYHIVMSKNLTKSVFFEFRAARVNYYKDTTLSTTYSSNNTGIKVDITPVINAGIAYAYQAGDVAVLYKPDGTNTYKLTIKEISGGNIVLDNTNIGDVTSGQNCIVEIYRPKVVSEEVLYYEIGSGYAIDQPGTIYRAFTITNASIPGDCYNILRNTYTWSGTAYQNASAQTLFKQMSQDIKSLDWNTDHGKIYIISDKGQVVRPYTFRHSGTFIDGTEANGLSEFYTGDEANTSYENGEIMKLKAANRSASEGTVLLAICRERVASIYIGESRLNINTETSFLVTGSQVIGEVNTLQGWYGTNHPSSVFDDGKNVYWFSQGRRAFVKYSQNGIFPISSLKVSSYFNDVSSKSITNDSTVVCGGYYPFYDIIMVTVNHSNAYSDSPGAINSIEKTISYSDENQAWMSFHSFIPDYYMDINDKMITFQSGKLFRHDNDNLFNTYNGNTHYTKIKVPVTANPLVPKFWQSLQIFASPMFITWSGRYQVMYPGQETDIVVKITGEENQYTQKATISFSDLQVYESIIYSRIGFDENSDGGVTDGDDMISRTAIVELSFKCYNFRYINLLKIGYIPSYGHTL